MDINELERLDKLRKENIITEQEFQREKEKILNGDQNTYDVNVKAKSKLAAGILGICLGALGVHNFYLGYTGKAFAQLLISILSFGILSPISAVWGFIEGILILSGDIDRDANDIMLKE